jgi:hypothetical protein
MNEPKFTRRPVLDPAVADLLAGMEQKHAIAQLPKRKREKLAREHAKMEARREQRATYDLPPLVRQKIRELAEEQHLPASQLVSLALIRFLEDIKNEKIDLDNMKEPSRSPRYDWNLILPGEPAMVTTRRKK